MASHVSERRLGVGLTPRVGTDLRFAIVMTNTTADTETEIQFVGSFATLDEYDGASYARQSVASEAAAVDLTNSRFELTFDPVVFATLGVGTRQGTGLLQLLHVTNDSDSPPDVFYEVTDFDGNGEDVTFTPDAQGAVQAANA
jgi:hypothetical protein